MSAELAELQAKIDASQYGGDLDLLAALAAEQQQRGMTPQACELLCAAYLDVYYLWLMDLYCDKFAPHSRQSVVQDLLDILAAVEVLDPQACMADKRANCYQLMADYAENDQPQALQYLQTAIAEYELFCEKTGGALDHMIAQCLLAIYKIRQAITPQQFAQLLVLHKNALVTFEEQAFIGFLTLPFSLQTIAGETAQQFASQATQAFDALAHELAQQNDYVYFVWSKELRRAFEHYGTQQAENAVLLQKAADLLGKLRNVAVHSSQRCSDIGNEFCRQARDMLDSSAQKLDFFAQAILFYQHGWQSNASYWTFPVYIANAQQDMARVLLRNAPENSAEHTAQARQCFAAAVAVFQQAELHLADDFTLQLNHGECLLNYARYAAPDERETLLLRARQKLLIAKEQGNGFYSQPFIGLAKVALQLRQIDQCVAVLQECRQHFAPLDSVLDDIRRDEEFAEIWPLLA